MEIGEIKIIRKYRNYRSRHSSRHKKIGMVGIYDKNTVANKILTINLKENEKLEGHG